MKYAVIGFPRIGEYRELKFVTEQYFRGECDEKGLLDSVCALRAKQWQLQDQARVDFISANDFSLYDNLLDTATLLNVIPRRYVNLGLSKIGTYFAMARGYQGIKGDVKAFVMKKWFNTNYHYMVPEFDDDVSVKLESEQFIDAFLQAKKIGIKTKPVVIGPFTFLKLAKFSGQRNIKDYVASFKDAYADILSLVAKHGGEWVEFDEPYLVKDLTKDDIALFEDLYQYILGAKHNVKVLLQTYFGDIRDCYNQIW